MELRDAFNQWGRYTGGRFASRQWLLAKWEVCEGVVWPQEKIDRMIALVEKRLLLGLNDTLLDLGCGGGWILKRLAPETGCAFGVDFSTEMLQNAAVIEAGDGLIQGEIGRLPFKSGVVDRALCYFVLINMMEDAVVECSLLDMLRVIKPGGRLLVGQLPDVARAADYDRAKASYLEFCRKEYDLGADMRDINRMPQKLFDVTRVLAFLDTCGVRYEKLPAFNPFYRPGESETIDWRFDLLIYK